MTGAVAASPGAHPAGACSRTLVDEWVRGGLRHAFVAPGSRSTPLALALAERRELRTEVVLDERAAAFMALGAAIAGGRPALVLTTSGTATTHLHAAVVEASLSNVPLLVCTADRPPELRDVGAAQTIEQTGLYGGAVRRAFDLGVPDAANRPAWRSLAARALAECCGAVPGPVHLNLPFREPLVGADPDLPPGRPDGAPWHRHHAPTVATLGPLAATARGWVGRRGVIVAGGPAGVASTGQETAVSSGAHDPAAGSAVIALARRLGWPVLADPRSGCRVDDPVVVAHADALLRDTRWADEQRPDVVLSFGQPPASKVLNGWLAAAALDRSMPFVQVNPAGSWWDPDRAATDVVAASADAFAGAVLDALGAERAGGVRPADGWLVRWRAADDAAEAVLAAELDAAPTPDPGSALDAAPIPDPASALDPASPSGPAGGTAPAGGAAAADGAAAGVGALPGVHGRPTEPAVARAVAAAAARHGATAIVVSSSMPVRDLEWYAGRASTRATPSVIANRGANGIDGVVATALGVACAVDPAPVWLVIGDLALLHDGTALLNAATRRVRLRMVVVDNAGGGIFSFLPQAAAVPADRFERLFGTAVDVDVAALLRLHGIHVEDVARAVHLDAALDRVARSRAAVAAVVVRVPDRTTNTAVHDHLHRRITAARQAIDERTSPAAGAPAR